MISHQSVLFPQRSEAVLSRSLLLRMGMVRRKATSSKSKLSPIEFDTRKEAYLHSIAGMIRFHAIPFQLIVNWDQTGIKLVPILLNTQCQVHGIGDKRQITATFAVSMFGAFLPMQILYEGKTERSHPKFNLPENFDTWYSPNHWPNAEFTNRFVEKIIIPLYKESKG